MLAKGPMTSKVLHLIIDISKTAVYYFGNEEEFTLTHQVFIDEKPQYYSFNNETKDLTGAEIFAQFNFAEKE